MLSPGVYGEHSITRLYVQDLTYNLKTFSVSRIHMLSNSQVLKIEEALTILQKACNESIINDISNMKVTLKIDNNSIIVSGNQQGLLELGSQILSQSLNDVEGSHMHFDENNIIEDSKPDLIVFTDNTI